MKLEQVRNAADRLFRGWDYVQTYETESMARDDIHVRLTVSRRRLEAECGDYARALAQLFDRTQLADLARLIVNRQRTTGLRRYGRKRSASRP